MLPLRKLPRRIWSAVTALLLAVVMAHAVAPMQQDQGRSRGSAFSASTPEVSLRSGATAIVAKELLKFEPRLPSHATVAVAPVGFEPDRAVGSAHRDAAPGTADPALHPLSPRAPPYA